MRVGAALLVFARGGLFSFFFFFFPTFTIFIINLNIYF